MKFDSTGKSSSGARIFTLRVSVAEVEILRGLVKAALQYCPQTTKTEKTVQRLRAIGKCLNCEEINELIKKNVE
jgi:hypothetical protein